MQYCFVKLATSGEVHLCTAVTDEPVGVLQNLPSRGQQAEVMVIGVSKVRAGATDLAVAAKIGVDATSRAAALTLGTGASTTTFCVGRVIQIDAADNDASTGVSAFINCMSPLRAL